MQLQVKPWVSMPATKSTILFYSHPSYPLFGIIHNAYFNRSFAFYDVFEMIKILESLFNTLVFPQTSVQYRHFHTNNCSAIKYEKEETTMSSNAEATFVLHVKFRQNATWQGTIEWVDEKKSQNFRSSLEMIKLIDEALEMKSAQEQVSWESADA